MQPGNNPIERYKAERDGLDILGEIEELAASHGGWETIAPRDRERLKWIGTFFRKPTPGRFMMRIRITGGQTTAAQLGALAVLGERLGDGVLDLTTRQQIELRGIEIRDVPQIMDALEGADLSSLQTGMDNIRGVTCCPLAGVTPHELFDASPAGAEYTRIFVGNREFTNLPRKFNVAITGCLENCTQTETQDVGMTPATRRSDGQHGFNVVVGGKMGSGGWSWGNPSMCSSSRTRPPRWRPSSRCCSATRARGINGRRTAWRSWSKTGASTVSGMSSSGGGDVLWSARKRTLGSPARLTIWGCSARRSRASTPWGSASPRGA